MSATLMQFVPLLFILFFIVPPFWKIIKKSGWHPALSFVMIVPFANLLLLWLVAFKKWPTDNITRTFE